MKNGILQLAAKIPVPEKGQRIIVGIDGLSRSGKTTIGNFLHGHYVEQGVPAVLIHLDDYIVERKRRYGTGTEPWKEYYGLQWDVEQLKRELFAPLRTANGLSLAAYDEATDQHRIERIALPEQAIIIIEGVFLQRDEWRAHFDFLCYVDSPRGERFSRESPDTQKKLEKFEQRYWKAEAHYLETVKPKASADHLISN